MSGFFWNIRGFNKVNKQKVVHNWIAKHGIEFGALLETRVKEGKSDRIVTSTFKDWSMVSNYEFHRLGRIWVIWSAKVKLQVVFKSAQMITCAIEVEDGEELICSFIYASNFEDDRRELWRDIIQHQNSASFRGKPWLCCGDFNEILDIEEHSNFSSAPMVTPGMCDFQDVVRRCSFIDMAYHGPQFTWTNKRENDIICKKLDRALINDEWMQQKQQSFCVFDSGGCSDHLRGRIILQGQVLKPRGPFKFTNAIATMPDFKQHLDSFWARTEPLFHSTSALFRLSKKLKQLKPVLRKLSRSKLHDLSRRTTEAYEHLCACQTTSLTTVDAQAVHAESIAYDRWEKISAIEEKFLRQKSKLHWLNVGDKNNRFFHNALKDRQARNSIKEIETQEGVSLTSQEDIKTEAVRVFHGLLTGHPGTYESFSVDFIGELISFRCSEGDEAHLTSEVLEEEIKQVLFKMPLNKSPGPDGYTVEFFKETWPIIGKDFIVAVQSFFIYGFLPTGLNSTILALIPKLTAAKQMKDYRPISCCNVLYKVISKILANRLKTLLPGFIAPNQSAFVKDRLLMENLLLASELVTDYHKENISPRCAMKIDIAKAFDSVQWGFLRNVLTALQIPEKFIHWISLCISTPSFSVQVNGELAGFFRSDRGLRQGCSLSPYLFVISMNVLSMMLDRAAREGRFGYHPKCKNMNLTHLCFADDIMVFADGKTRSMEGILQVFGRFAAGSGLTISLEKSTLFMAGILPEIRDIILARFPFDSGVLPVRYLGLPLMTKRMSRADCLPLLEKIKAKIQTWKNRFLSFAGRLQLLTSVIASLTTFWMSAFRLPSACIKELEQISAAFLWSGPVLNTRKAKVSWTDVCRPKKEGGLGVKSLADANKVSCYKLIWRLVSGTTSLWVNWIQRSLIRNGSFWSVREKTSLGSWMWRKLLKYRPQVKDFHRVDINSGVQTSFWFSSWCSLGRLHDILGDRGYIDMGIGAAATVAEALATHRRRRHRLETLNLVEEEMETLRFRGLNQSVDVSLWRGAGGKFSPNFSSKDTWNQIRDVAQTVQWSKGVWFSHSTPKYSFIVWLAVQDRLATGEKMRMWNVGADPKCIFCQHPIESRDHLFFTCRFASQVWDNLTRGILHHRYTTSFGDIIAMLSDQSLSGPPRFILRYVFQASIHAIWRERNKRRHGEVPSPPSSIIRSMDRTVRNRLSSLQDPSSTTPNEGLIFWFASRG